MPPEFEMPSTALLAIDAHEHRLLSLEEDSRQTAAQLADHESSLKHLVEMSDVKNSDVKKDVAAVSQKIDQLASHVQSATSEISTSSARIAKLEEIRAVSQARWKWILASLGTVAVGGVGYAVQQLLSHLLSR